MANLDNRFPMNDFITIATLIDPASKNKKYLNLTAEEKTEILLTALREADGGSVINGSQSFQHQTLPSQGSGSATVSASAHSAKRLKLMDEFEDENVTGDTAAMVTQYLSVNEKPNKEERADPLLYWKNSKHTKLAALAKVYLTSSASSVPVESMFSIAGILLNGRRSSLAPHTFNKLIFLHDNAKLYIAKNT